MPAAKELTGTALERYREREAARIAAGLSHEDVARALSRGRRLTPEQLKNKIASVRRYEKHGQVAPVMANRLARIYKRGPMLFF